MSDSNLEAHSAEEDETRVVIIEKIDRAASASYISNL